MINGQSLMLSQNVLALDYNIFPPDNHNPHMHCDDDGMGALKKVMAEIAGGHYAKKENKKEEKEKDSK